ncbi:hypothetical protein [Methylocystis echinoides]|uniref:Uncharacterized protein n=1 Tax=Methylocystis echinoides TaxID=29468 RepID=A0A9W6GT45_9HYPH|nr:hypothetical protein [Methylocystis echinoides]GLI92546.1 hypothetical protein LMG27198_15380 [Methylocystis echinoides]
MSQPDADPVTRFNVLLKIAAVLALLLGSYNLWSFFTSSRYQALCGKSYWDLNSSQLDSCLEQKRNLEGK